MRPKKDGVARNHRKREALTAICVAMLFVTACSSSSEKAAQKAAEAAAFFDAGNTYGARVAALAAVAARDDVADYWRLLGRIELASDNINDAYNAYRRALELEAVNPEALQMVAEIALRAGRPREASEAADQLLALDPSQTRPKLIKGLAALSQNRDAEASALADEILASDPADEGGKVLKARVLGRAGKFEDAAAVVDNATTARSEIILATLSELRRSQGLGEDLARTLTEFYEKAPSDSRAFDLAAVQYKLGRVGEARVTLLDRLRQRKDDEGLHDRAFDFLYELDPDIFSAASPEPGLNTGRLKLLAARLTLERGKAAEAEHILSPVIGGGAAPDVWALYAMALDELGRPGADKIVANILEADESNGFALLVRGRRAMKRSDLTAALNDAQAVTRDDPGMLAARLLAIEVYQRRGDAARARQLFEEMVRARPQSLRAAEAYTGWLIGQNDRIRAIQVIEAYTFLNPERADGWKLLAKICDTGRCRQKAATGNSLAVRDFTPMDRQQWTRAGLFGALREKKS